LAASAFGDRYIVCPSGLDLTAISVAIIVAPPGRLSTTTCCFHVSPSFCATTRPTRSNVPPAANGTTTRTGRTGKSSAAAANTLPCSAPHSKNTPATRFIIASSFTVRRRLDCALAAAVK
jgi:hypothetical protein